MKKLIAAAFACCLPFIMGGAYAQDMKKDEMMKDMYKGGMMKDKPAKAEMTKGKTGKGGMMKDEKGGMMKDEMKK